MQPMLPGTHRCRSAWAHPWPCGRLLSLDTVRPEAGRGCGPRAVKPTRSTPQLLGRPQEEVVGLRGCGCRTPSQCWCPMTLSLIPLLVVPPHPPRPQTPQGQAARWDSVWLTHPRVSRLRPESPSMEPTKPPSLCTASLLGEPRMT